MANKLLKELLELPRPQNLTKEELGFYSTQLNTHEPGSKEFENIKNELAKRGVKIPEDNYLGVVITNWYENFTETPKYEQSNQTETPQYEAQNQTTLDSSTLEQLEKEAGVREQQRQETIENSKRVVEEAQKKLREIKARNDEILKKLEAQKDKKLYVKIESFEKREFTKEEALDFDNYKEYLKSVKSEEIPEAVDKLAQEIESRIGGTLQKQGLDNEEIKLITENTAAEIIDNLVKSDDPQYVPPTHIIAVAETFITSPKEIKKITKDQKTQNLIKENARFTSPESLLQGYERNVAEAAFGPEAASKFFGPKPENLTVNISETPQPNYTETYTPYVAYRTAQFSLKNHDQNLEELKQRGIEEGKRILVQDARSLIRTRLELIHPQSTAGRFLQSNKAEYFLRAFGVGPQDGLSLIEKIGVDYGIGITAGAKTAIWAKTTTQTAISIANTGGVMQMEAFLGGAAVSATTKVAAKTGIKAAISTTLASIGISIPVPILNVIAAAVGWLVGEVFGKLIEKYGPQIKKFFKEVLGPLLLVGGGMMFGAPVLGLAAGGLAFGLARGATLAGIGSGIWGFFARIGSAFVITIATPIIIALLVIPPLVAFIMLVINNSAYMVPPNLNTTGGVILSPYIDVIKTPNPPGPFENNELPLTVEYTVTIKAKKGTLTNVQISYSCQVVKESPGTNCPQPEPEVPTTIDQISPASPFTFTYKQTYNSPDFQDSLVTDTITVTADVDGKTGQVAAGSATIKIGDPPEECPSEWPTDNSGIGITQGPYSSSGMSHNGTESIDIGVGLVNVYAGHSGTVITSSFDSCLGNNVEIKSNCNGKDFYSRYSHLEALNVSSGQEVTTGQTIGLSGGTGTCSTGYHLHYEFRYWPDGKPSWPDNPPFMMKPYIPMDVPRGCESITQCGVSY
jgi:murein DD-endopeptidase MepM/ murein hydrolase activator NlpD